MFFCEFCEIFKNIFFIEPLRTAASVSSGNIFGLVEKLFTLFYQSLNLPLLNYSGVDVMKRNEAYIALIKPSIAPSYNIETKIYVCKLREHFVSLSLIFYRFLILALIKKAQFKKGIIYTFFKFFSSGGKEYGAPLQQATVFVRTFQFFVTRFKKKLSTHLKKMFPQFFCVCSS